MLNVDPRALAPPAADARAAQDYARVRRAIEFIARHRREQPEVARVAEAVDLSPSHLTHLFRRWAGLTPKAFLQALTLDHARALLRQSASVLDASFEVGLSGPGRLHDLFVQHEAMTPGQYKRGGEGLTLTYGFHSSPFGESILAATPHGLAAIGWVDEKEGPGRAGDSGKPAGGRAGALADLRRRWPLAVFVEDEARAAALAARVFDPALWREDRPLRIVLIGADFEVRVWESLLRVPFGSATTYGALAAGIGKPGAARAVGAAVGRNPLSFVVPCHRVLAADGRLTGYHWGLARKQAILGWEAGRLAA